MSGASNTGDNGSQAANNNINGSSGGGEEDTLSSFTNIGADGLDTSTANLFGSFINDSAQSTDNSGGDLFGQFSSADLSGFGVDLSSLELGGIGINGGNGTSSAENRIDLSSIQLLNLDEMPPSNNNNTDGSNQVLGSTTDAAQMVAQLLGSSTQPAVSEATNTLSSTLPISQLSNVSIAGGQSGAALTAQRQITGKSRSSSQSSDDMGDVPLAQLALLNPEQASQQSAALPLSALRPQEMVSADQMHSASALGGMGSVSAVAPGIALSAVQSGATAIAGLSQPTTNVPISGNLHPEQAQAQLAMRQLQMIGAGVGSAGDMLASAVAASTSPNTTAPVTSTPHVIESGITGVDSTVLQRKSRDTEESVNTNLQLELEQPNIDDNMTPLDELEQIEDQLCSLLGTASKAIRMMTGTRASGGQGQDTSSSGLESTIKEFMHTVAKIQADMIIQHKKLVARGIPIQMAAAFQNDTAGFERDLVAWSDTASLLAEALESGLRISSNTMME
ncbi:hypothetical protein COEREDRAFT_89146 [Coemansia reversa NRRL 1564]|uniref:Mediator of RNA polymerase II transcription subunit 11 n=1 Tax=Coemansia reversa (strain ATCC 12441 / NRRL 1564) TaxID=763665 RepID=A0A2G5B4K8_COERN|nr:hypothetical protein COEREDRAFT_89146 [Coemansia reversa NRRL 1564]|eukprot:PIA13932.1 hypothetical protein COEREDRAFT_89146 [Coemansia reversa NRRL 1564]